MATLPSGPAPAAPVASPPAPAGSVRPPSPRFRGRRPLVIAVVVAVVLAGVLGALVVLGSSSPAPPPTFSQAWGEANGSVANVSGGGWTLLVALGLDQRTGATVSVAAATNTTASACTPVAIGSAPLPTNLTIPGYGGSFGAGRAPLWLFVYRQSSSGPYLLADVTGGGAAAVAELTGSACASNLSAISPIPAKFVDSPAVAASAWSGSVDASGFVAGDPAIDTLVMVAAGASTHGGFPLPAGWLLEYAPCGPFVTGTLTQETTFVAAFDASGSVVCGSPFTSTTGCPASAS